MTALLKSIFNNLPTVTTKKLQTGVTVTHTTDRGVTRIEVPHAEIAPLKF